MIDLELLFHYFTHLFILAPVPQIARCYFSLF
jgi:hypothetical protein